MKSLKILLVLLLLAAGLGGLLRAYKRGGVERGREAREEKAIQPPAQAKRNAAGELEIRLDKETQARAGLRVAAAQPARLRPELKGYGRVLDPAPLLALAGDLAAAQATLAASRAESDRLKALQGQGNASLRALQTAAAAARRDELLTQSLEEKLLLAYGDAVSRQGDLPAFVHSLDTRQRALVRVDLPGGTMLPGGGSDLKKELDSAGVPEPRTARLVSLAGDTILAARWFGPAPATDPLTQGRGTLWLVETNAQRLAPGDAVTAYLEMPGEPARGFLVPRAAVVVFGGRAWYYTQTAEDTFARVGIALDHPLDNGWFVPGEPPARVVVAGAQMLLSEEQKHQIAMPD